MRFFVQDTEEFENNGIEYKSLDKAIEACLEAKK